MDLQCHYVTKNFIIENKNFINNTVNSNWFGFHSSSLTLSFEECFFYQFSEKSVSSNSISIIFNKCFFEKEISNSFLSYCQINSNSIFNISLNCKINLELINSKYCWNQILIKESCQNDYYLKFKISTLILNFLII